MTWVAVGAVFLAAAIWIAKAEYPDWGRRLARIMVRITARLRPATTRSRSRDEWLAELAAIPHESPGATGLGYALGLFGRYGLRAIGLLMFGPPHRVLPLLALGTTFWSWPMALVYVMMNSTIDVYNERSEIVRWHKKGRPPTKPEDHKHPIAHKVMHYIWLAFPLALAIFYQRGQGVLMSLILLAYVASLHRVPGVAEFSERLEIDRARIIGRVTFRFVLTADKDWAPDRHGGGMAERNRCCGRRSGIHRRGRLRPTRSECR